MNGKPKCPLCDNDKNCHTCIHPSINTPIEEKKTGEGQDIIVESEVDAIMDWAHGTDSATWTKYMAEYRARWTKRIENAISSAGERCFKEGYDEGYKQRTEEIARAILKHANDNLKGKE